MMIKNSERVVNSCILTNLLSFIVSGVNVNRELLKQRLIMFLLQFVLLNSNRSLVLQNNYIHFSDKKFIFITETKK